MRARKTDIADEMVFRIKADFLKALGHPIRLEVVEFLKNGEASAGSVVKALGVEQSTLSRHLCALREIGVLHSRQEKTTVYYSIADKDIFEVLRPIAEMLRKKFKKSEKLLAKLGK